MSSGPGKILIFDDDEDILSICSYYLSNKGWKVFTHTNSYELLKKVEDIMPDIILMDNWLPGDGGIIATQQLKATALLKQIPVIFFSANNEIDRLAREAGADAILEKPFDFETFDKVLSGVQ